MSARFRFSPGGQGQSDPWFRIGTLEVTTTVAVVLLSVVSILAYAVGGAGPQLHLVMFPDEVLHGQVWRVVTWPFANPGISIWTVLNLFFFWYFGTEIEGIVGRAKMVWLVAGFTLALTAAALIVGLLLNVSGNLAALGAVELMLLLTWIAEYPTRRFFFNIPAWVFGAVIVGLQVVSALGSRDGFSLLSLLLGLVLCALIARGLGLLGELHFVPKLGSGTRRRRRAKPAPRTYQPGRPTVVPGPWQAPRSVSDQARLDELLDKISERGLDGLTDAERHDLQELRKRRLGG